MLRSLRNRLIFSHILPALIIIPLMGAAMVYVLETRLLLPTVYNNLAKEAKLMGEVTRNYPIIWQNRQAAQVLVNSFSPFLNGKVSVVTLDGQLLASSDSTATGITTQTLDLPDLTQVNQGQVVALQNGPLAEAITPVYDLNGRRIGVIRMTTQVVTVSEASRAEIARWSGRPSSEIAIAWNALDPGFASPPEPGSSDGRAFSS